MAPQVPASTVVRSMSVPSIKTSEYSLPNPIDTIVQNIFLNLETATGNEILSFTATDWPYPAFLFPYTHYKTPLLTDEYVSESTSLVPAKWPRSCSFPAENNSITTVFLLGSSSHEHVYIEDEEAWVLHFAKDNWEEVFSVNLVDIPKLEFIDLQQDKIVRCFNSKQSVYLLTVKGHLVNFTKSGTNLTYVSHITVDSYEKCEQFGLTIAFLKKGKVEIFSKIKQMIDQHIAFPPVIADVMAQENCNDQGKVYPPYSTSGNYLISTNMPKAFHSSSKEIITNPWKIERPSFLLSQNKLFAVVGYPLAEGKRQIDIVSKREGTRKSFESLERVKVLTHPELTDMLLEFNATTLKIRVLSSKKEFIYQSKSKENSIYDVCLGKERLYILYKTNDSYSLHEIVLGQSNSRVSVSEREDSPPQSISKNQTTPGKTLKLSRSSESEIKSPYKSIRPKESIQLKIEEKKEPVIAAKEAIPQKSFWEGTVFKVVAAISLLGAVGGLFYVLRNQKSSDE